MIICLIADKDGKRILNSEPWTVSVFGMVETYDSVEVSLIKLYGLLEVRFHLIERNNI